MEESIANFLERHADAIPLQTHAAATHRRLDLGAEAGKSCSWTADDTARVLQDVPYDEHLGLKFYHVDPLPWIRQACNQAAKFVDYEFPTHTPVNLNGKRLEPGIITAFNCRDFQSEGPKRARRIRHFCKKAENAWVWVRASSMKDAALFSSPESINPRNVLQGAVGNCGFCSGFASIAADFPEVIRDAFGEHSAICILTCGAYSVRLFPRGQERYLLLDDYIICRSDGSHRSPSLHSLERSDMWIRLLEKVFVKIQGSYASLDGYYKFKSLYRHPARALQLLKGAALAVEIHYNTTNVEEVYDTLLASQGICAGVVHCRTQAHGLFSNHGYSLLWVGETAGVRLVCLRNPHGRGSYVGEYGFGSRVWEKNSDLVSELLTLDFFVWCHKTKRVTWCRGSDKFGERCTRNGAVDDGIFFMEFSAFVDFFPITTMVGPMNTRASNVKVPDRVYRLSSAKLSHLKEILVATREKRWASRAGTI